MDKELETINIGIVGHIDHGKTTLLQKISGVWASRHSEELKRGITIKLGYAEAKIYDDSGRYNIEKKGKEVRKVSFVDAPGHEMLMATMLSGAAIMDGAILVVAANEGIKPQTREHFMALCAKKIKNLIVVQNKIDLVDRKKAEENYKEIKELIKGKYDNAPIIPVSAQQGINISEVLKAICEIKIPDRDSGAKPVFIVARSFDINKPGTKPEGLHGAVLGGTLKQGILKIGEEIEIKPGRRVKEGNNFAYKVMKTKITGIFRGSEKISELTPGGSVSIETELDMALGKGDLLAGNLAACSGCLPEPINKAKIKFNLFPEVFGLGGHNKVEPIKPSESLMLNVNASATGGFVRTVKKDELDIELKIPIVVFKGDNIAIARNILGHWRLIGFGEII